MESEISRVWIIADSAVTRAGLEALVREAAGLELAGSSSGRAAIAGDINAAQAEAVLWEVADLDDSARSPVAVGAGSPPVVALLPDDAEPARIASVLRSGVRAVLPRTAEAHEIVAAIHAAATGLAVLPPDVLTTLLARSPSHPPTLAGQPLSARESEVLNMLAAGLGNKEIAWKLGISEHTVKFHVSSILTKLDASSRTEAVTVGIRLGLVML